MDTSLTKVFLMTPKDTHAEYFDCAFGARPEFEIYERKNDPDQVRNVAVNADYSAVQQWLTKRMMKILKQTRDPRVVDGGKTFDQKPFVDPAQPAKKESKF